MNSFIDKYGPRSWEIVENWAKALTEKCGVTIETIGREHLSENEARVFITNHRSHYDIPSIVVATGLRLHFITKKELFSIPLFGRGMRALDMIEIDRSDKSKALSSMENAARMVREGRNVLVFAEGTRSKDGKSMQPFKKGGFHLALQAQVPVQPLVVLGSERVLPKHTMGVTPGTITVKIGAPIPVHEGDDLSELMEQTRQVMQRMIDEEEF